VIGVEKLLNDRKNVLRLYVDFTFLHISCFFLISSNILIFWFRAEIKGCATPSGLTNCPLSTRITHWYASSLLSDFLGRRTGYPLYPLCAGCVSVGGAGASSVSLHPPTVTSAATAGGCRSYPWRSTGMANFHLPFATAWPTGYGTMGGNRKYRRDEKLLIAQYRNKE
jgi:hypothetical protein